MLEKVVGFLKSKNKVKAPVVQKGSFVAHNPIFSIENDFVISKDGMVWRGYRIFEPYYEEVDKEGYDSMSTAISLAIQELPPGSAIHRYSVFHNVYFNERRKNYDFDYSKFFDHQKKEHLLTRPILSYETYLYLGLSANPSISKKKRNQFNTFFSLGTLGNELGNLEKVVSGYDGVANEVLGRLSAVGIKHEKLSTKELRENFCKYFNLDFSPSGKDDINQEYLNKYPYYSVGTKIVGINSYDGQVKEIRSSVKNRHGVTAAFNHRLYHSLEIPHIVNQFVFVRDSDEVLSEINEEVGHFRGAYEDEVATTVEEYVKAINQKGDRIVEFGTNIITWSNNQQDLEVFQELASGAIKSLGNCDARNEVIEDAANLFWSSVPGAIHQNYRTQLIPATKVAPFLLYSGRYYDKGTFLVRGRDNRPVFIATEPDDLSKANNYVIVGPTGGGKSFLMNALACHYYERGDELLIVDKGNSYGMICKRLGGTHYDFEDYSKVNLNFFPTAKDNLGRYVVTEVKKTAIKSQFKVMWRFDKGGSISSSEDSVLDVLIELFYEMVNLNSVYPTMDLWVDFCKSLDEQAVINRLDLDIRLADYFNMNDFLLALSKYTTKSGGAYSTLYNGSAESELQVDTRFTLFDVRNVAQDKLVFTLFNVSLMNLILEKVYGRKHVRKHVWMDETSETMKTELGDILRLLYREIRKENGDVAIIVQLITDISETPNGKVILDNAMNKIILDHKKATNSLPILKEVLQLTSHKFDQILSLNKVPSDVMREFAYIKEDKLSVFGLEVPEILRKSFSTDPKDQVPLLELMKKCKDPMIALREYMEILNTKKEPTEGIYG